jgi:DNA polymerase III epsilon subunit family exonuclease
MQPLGVANLSQLKYVVFDIETTGFSRDRDRIIQISGVKVDGGRIPRSLRNQVSLVEPKKPFRNDDKIYNGFINPGKKISRKITKLTGITNNMVRNQPREKKILSEFFEFAGDRILVAHNGIRFDIPFVQKTVERNNLRRENLLCLDTLWLSRKLYTGEGKHNLDAVTKRYNLDRFYPSSFLSQRHNALVDVMLTAEALKLFISKLKRKGKDKLTLL